MSYADIIALIGAGGQWVAATFAAGIFWQAWIMRRSMKHDHDMLRRRTAIDVITRWTELVPKESKAAERLFSRLDIEQCQNIENVRAMKLEIRHRELLFACLEEEFPMIENDINKKISTASGGEVTVDERYVRFIRRIAVSLLNNNEVVLTAWKHHVGDRVMIEEQFREILVNDSNPLREFMDITGGSKKFPATYEFIETMRNASKPAPGKPATG